MNLIVTSQPLVEPVTLEDVYGHLRLDPSDSPPGHPDDAMLERHIETARNQVEQMTRRALVDQEIRLTLECFPWNERGYIELLRPPLLEVVSVKYYDVANVLQTVDEDDYFTTEDLVPRLMFSQAFAFPCTYLRSDAVQITYRAGYPMTDDSPPSVEEVPEQLKDAILIGVELLYDDLSTADREALEQARESLVVSFRIPA